MSSPARADGVPPSHERSRPFGIGTVSLGLHPETGVDANRQAAGLLACGVAAEAAGFDGVTISEHHAGFPGYMPQPLVIAAAVLAKTQRVWSGPCPVLLNLRNPVLLAEELAWLHACFPGRVGAAVAPGYAEQDFVATGADYELRLRQFPALLRDFLQALTPGGAIGHDAAIAALTGTALSILSAANSKARVVAAAASSIGIVFPGGETPERLARLVELYREQGGTGPVVWIKNIWIGARPGIETSTELAYRDAAASGMRQRSGFADGQLAGTGAEVAEALVAGAATIGATSINLRLHAAGADAGRVIEQIQTAGSDVVPSVGTALTQNI